MRTHENNRFSKPAVHELGTDMASVERVNRVIMGKIHSRIDYLNN